MQAAIKMAETNEKKQKLTSVDVEKLQPSFITGRNENGIASLGTSRAVTQNVKHSVAI